MDKADRKKMVEEYENRKPDMGIVCWRSGDRMWIGTSTDAAADYNSTSFQLKLGTWPNKELQKAYTENPDSFEWSLLKRLDYEERDADHRDELELLYMICMDEYPNAKKMRVGRK